MPGVRKALLFLMFLACGMVVAQADERVVVGSKRFTESYILGEIVAQTARITGVRAEHRPGLGNTAVVLEALKAGSIDIYPEYLGTVEQEILKLPTGSAPETIARELARLGLAHGVPLGFSNSYALATTEALAGQRGLRRISDLRAQPDLRVALSQEFLGRADGWPGLAARYGLPQRPSAIDHGLSYAALATARIDVTDIYTTDARIAELKLHTLQDDAHYFPRYDAVLLYRADLPQRAPLAWQRIAGLQGRIDTARMIAMNAEAELQGRSFAQIAAGFLSGDAGTVATPTAHSSFWQRLTADDLGRLTRQHLLLVAVSLALATLIGVPLGALAAAWRPISGPVMAVVGLMQTIPSLALLAALIPLLGRIGTVPAIVALTLYALLPIVRNTATGLEQVPRGLKDAGLALGMTRAQCFRLVDLPLAAPVLLAGLKTAAVLTVGTATIAAFIGAGGYGERIAQGLALNDGAMLLAGAVPSAALALLTQGAFALLERWAARR